MSERAGLPRFRDPRPALARRRRHAMFNGLAHAALVLAMLWAAGAVPALRDPIHNALLVMLFYAACLLPHELGHALAARLLGMRVHLIRIGIGPVALSAELFAIEVELCLLPLGGFTLTSHRYTSHARTRQWLMTLAGPAANAAIVLPAFLLAPVDDLLLGWLGPGLDPLSAYVLANGLIIFFNLLPYRATTPLGPVGSDGLALVTIPLASDAQVRDWNSSHYLIEALRHYRRQRYDQALASLDHGHAMYPEDLMLDTTRTAVLVAVGRFDEAIDRYRALLQRDDLDTVAQAMAMNNLAAACVRSGEPALLDEADQHSQQALEAMPWVTAFRATRGSVLVARGEPAAGLELLEAALPEMTHPRDIATTLVSVAQARFALDDTAAAADALAIARQIDPRCPTLLAAEQSLLAPADPDG